MVSGFLWINLIIIVGILKKSVGISLDERKFNAVWKNLLFNIFLKNEGKRKYLSRGEKNI